MKKLLLVFIITLVLVGQAWGVKTLHIGGQTSIISFLFTKSNIISLGIDYDGAWSVYTDTWTKYTTKWE